MFKKRGNFYTNKNEEFLKSSDLVIFWREKPKHLIKDYVVIGGEDKYSKVDIPKSSKKLPLLLARLSYVFEIYDEKLEEFEEFEDFIENLKSIRVKKEIKFHNTTLEEISGVLYLIDNAKKVAIIASVDGEEMEGIISFAKLIGDRVSIFSKNDISNLDLKFYE